MAIPENDREQIALEHKKESILNDILMLFSDDIPFLKKVNRVTYGLFSGRDDE